MSTFREQSERITSAARESRPAEVTEVLERRGKKTGRDLMAVHASPGTAGDPAAAVRSLVAGADIEIIPLRNADEKLKAVPGRSTVTVTTSGKLGLERTLEFAGKALRAGYEVVPHLAARQLAGEEELRRFIGKLGELGISQLYLIGGMRRHPRGRMTPRCRSFGPCSRSITA